MKNKLDHNLAELKSILFEEQNNHEILIRLEKIETEICSIHQKISLLLDFSEKEKHSIDRNDKDSSSTSKTKLIQTTLF